MLVYYEWIRWYTCTYIILCMHGICFLWVFEKFLNKIIIKKLMNIASVTLFLLINFVIPSDVKLGRLELAEETLNNNNQISSTGGN